MYVDDDAGDGGDGSLEAPFAGIQDAVNASEDGDTVRVFSGTYPEHVKVNKTLNIVGNGSSETRIECYNTGFEIEANWTNISDFYIKGKGHNFYSNSGGINIEAANVTISQNVCDYLYNGIRSYRENSRIVENTCINNVMGIGARTISNSVLRNTCLNNEIGIFLHGLENGVFSGNNVSHNEQGFVACGTKDVEISNNFISYNTQGLFTGTYEYRNVSFLDNQLSNNKVGASLHPTTGLRIKNNVFSNCGVFFSWGAAGYRDTDPVDESNTVNGKPLLVLNDLRNETIAIQAGHLLLDNCSNLVIKDVEIANATLAFGASRSDNITFLNCSARENTMMGFFVTNSCDNISITKSSFVGNSKGADLYSSRNIRFSECFFKGNEKGAEIVYCEGVSFQRCEITGNQYGLFLDDFILKQSKDISCRNCNIYDNSEYGIFIRNEGKVTATGNWWGNVSGPYHESSNPESSGDRVSSEVNFESWLSRKIDLQEPEDDQEEQNIPVLLLLGSGGLAIVGISAIFLFLHEPFRFSFFHHLTPLYTRLNEDKISHDIAQQNTRGQIYRFVLDHPGANLSTICKTTSAGYGTTVYHLSVLQREGRLRASSQGGKKLFWAKEEFPGQGKARLTETQEKILTALKEKGEALSRKQLEKRTGIPTTTLHRNLGVLAKQELVIEKQDGKEKVVSLKKAK